MQGFVRDGFLEGFFQVSKGSFLPSIALSVLLEAREGSCSEISPLRASRLSFGKEQMHLLSPAPVVPLVARLSLPGSY
ncbi:MAG: hypothetical protein NVS4B9_31870 [Ktedonobacteraceae bacterium]